MHSMFNPWNSGNQRFTAILITILVAFAIAANATAQPAGQTTFDRIDRFVESQMRAHRIPGLALAVVQGDQIVHSAGFGEAGPNRAMTPQTPLYIGSVSKSITALAVMQLVEAGEIDLDAPVQQYIPWFQVADDAASDDITVRHLLNQNSGLSEASYTTTLPAGTTLEDAVRNLRTAPVDAPVGSEYNYFSPNYDTLGLIVERVSGQSFAQYTQENVFALLDMQNSTANPDVSAQIGLAQGHTAVFGFPVARRTGAHEYDVPSGWIASSAEDMAHFLIAQLNGGIYGDHRVLSPQGVKTMHTPLDKIDSPYAMGWEVTEQEDVRLVWHNGDVETFHANVTMLPEHGYGIVYLANLNGFLPSFFAWPALESGLVDILLDTEPSTGLSVSLISIVLVVVVALDIFQSTRSLFKLPGWWQDNQDKSARQLAPGIAWDLLFPILVLLAVQAGLNALLEGRFNWLWAIRLAPGMIAWLFLGTALKSLRGLVKMWYLLNRHRQTQVEEAPSYG